jgi:transcriptional regulator with XRE-family HTH domain
MDRFSENLSRLLGLHALPAKEAAEMLGISQSAFTKWATGKRNPSFTTALLVGEFFGVPADRLARADFGCLLEGELASSQRFDEVEAEIRRRRSILHEVGSQPSGFLPRKVIAMEEATEAQRLRKAGLSEEEIKAALERQTAEDEASTLDTDEEGSR